LFDDDVATNMFTFDFADDVASGGWLDSNGSNSTHLTSDTDSGDTNGDGVGEPFSPRTMKEVTAASNLHVLT
jgi:hypothetical protein